MSVAEEPEKIILENTSEVAESVKKVNSDGDACVEEPPRRFEGKVTPEQELSASVARRRRNISKKRSASAGRTRDQTPAREIPDSTPPITPERKKSKSRKSSIDNTSEILSKEPTNSKEDDVTKVNDDVSNLLNKAKSVAAKEKSAARRKEIKKAAIKRSKSAPRPDTQSSNDKELIENFKQAQLISSTLEFEQPEVSKDSEKPQRPTSIPLFSNILRRRKLAEEIEQIEEPQKPVNKRITYKEVRQKWKQFKTEFSHEYNKIKSLSNRCLNDTVLLMIFCGFGGLMFKFTEGTFENFYKCGVKRVKRDFIDALWRGSHHLREEDWKSLARTKLRDFEEQLHTAHEAGVTSYSGQRSWSFLNGIVYALTIVTTIGYGHMYPTTTTGMALTIVYALIGIPLFLIILTDFGKLFTRVIKFVWAFVRRLYYTGTCKQARKVTGVQEVMKGAQMMYDIATFRRPSQFNLEDENGTATTTVPPKFPTIQPYPAAAMSPHSRDGDTDAPNTPAPSTYEIDDEFNLPISVALFLLVLYIFLGAVVYYVWEQWDFFASFYFVFISMSTIGFGDYVPRHPICMIVSIIYLVFGLALMSMCINVVQVKLSDTFRQASAKLGATIGLTVADEDGSITTVPPPAVEIPDIHVSNKSV